MAIKQRLSEEDLALVEVLEDPIWLAEMARSTRDFSPNRSIWLKEPFKYRPYQKDLITDNHEYIALTGGRCQPAKAKVLTTRGYKSIFHLRKDPYFEVFCFDEHGNITTRRAVLVKDSSRVTYTVTTTSGHKTYCTDNHPFLTESGEYKELKDLAVGDKVVVMTKLPFHPQTLNYWRYPETTFVGFRFMQMNWKAEKPFVPRFEQIATDYAEIARIEGANCVSEDGALRIMRKFGKRGRNPFNKTLEQVAGGLYDRKDTRYIGYVPNSLMTDNLDNQKRFIACVLAQYAEFAEDKITLECYKREIAAQLHEILLRLGIETRICEGKEPDSKIETIDYRAAYRTYQLGIPGVLANLKSPQASQDRTEYTRLDEIVSIERKSDQEAVYSLYVYDYHNYIADGFVVHNSIGKSVVLEDKHIYLILNQDREFPETKELLLTTNNMAQMEPILGRLLDRFRGSRLLRDYLTNVNRASGVFDFRFNDIPFKFRARIAGGEKENSVVGLHLNRIIIDEGQLYPGGAFKQLLPVLNTWEEKIQLFVAGVSNGLRNSTLYQVTMKSPHFKWYRIPSPNNSFFTLDDYMRTLREYGGEDSDDFKRMVLGFHGSSSIAVLAREQIQKATIPFYNYAITGVEIKEGIDYQDRFELHDFKSDRFILAIDCGFVDPTVISVIGQNQNGRWYYLARYKMTRVDYNIQEQVIHYLSMHYRPDHIAIDYGSAGVAIAQSLINRQEFKGFDYQNAIIPVMFGENLTVGYRTDGKEIKVGTKSIGAASLIEHLQDGTLTLSEMDHEALNELEKITKQNDLNGNDRYFVMSDRGIGAAKHDHIFASLICFAIAIRNTDMLKQKRRKKLGKSSGKF